jgi:hypothetical protein
LEVDREGVGIMERMFKLSKLSSTKVESGQGRSWNNGEDV